VKNVFHGLSSLLYPASYWFSLAYFRILKMESIYSFEISVDFYQTARGHILKDYVLRIKSG
jgi:hypothetical protein